ncbi:PE domain-containing protein [Mycobacterium spongiae]|uniref:PE domain-containing protein n=1 Tax=Mycobacterium spongiae TaxID=886343 RepID=A0A975K0R2_9MYCO|nr:PE domain-containing protein [Mycobacterium spongiae]
MSHTTVCPEVLTMAVGDLQRIGTAVRMRAALVDDWFVTIVPASAESCGET